MSKTRSAEPITRLEHGLRGRPLLLGDLDANFQEYVRKLRLAGGIVTRAIVIAAATGIVEYNNPALLHTHGGPVVLGKKWADSVLGRMGLGKRKATKAARKLPDDFAGIKLAFLQRVVSIVKENDVPFDLVIN